MFTNKKLMLSYIRQFYASFSTDGSVIVRSAINDKTPVTPVAKSDPIVIRKEEPKLVLPEEIEAHVAPPKPKSVNVKKEQPIALPPPSEAPTKSDRTTVDNEEIDHLFQHQQAKELSEHLSELPIKDLTKSMGLNEKILTTNELFGKNTEAFNKALTTLNSCKNFEEAKNHLAEYAKTFDWTKKSNKKKAQIFIKLVRRRFK